MAGVFVAAAAASSLTCSPVGIIAVIFYGLLMIVGGLFIGLLLGLLLQISDVLPLSPWHQAAHIVAVLVVAALAWSSTDVALDPSYLAERVSEPVAEHTPRS